MQKSPALYKVKVTVPGSKSKITRQENKARKKI